VLDIISKVYQTVTMAMRLSTSMRPGQGFQDTPQVWTIIQKERKCKRVLPAYLFKNTNYNTLSPFNYGFLLITLDKFVSMINNQHDDCPKQLTMILACYAKQQSTEGPHEPIWLVICQL